MLRGVLAQIAEERVGAFARGTTQYRVDEAVTGAGGRAVCLCQLDGVRDDGAVGGAAQIQQLVQAETQRREQRRVEPCGCSPRETLDHVVERAAPLDGAEREAHRKRAVARVERARLGLQSAVGVGALLEHAAYHRVCANARLSRHVRAGMPPRPSGACPAVER